MAFTNHEELPRDQFLKNIEGARVENIEEMLAAQSRKPKIRRVPYILRDHKHFVKYYEPRAIALGPLHHGKESCMPAEKFKPALAARFIQDSGHPAEDLLEIIECKIKILRNCYDEESTMLFSDEALAQLLFLDGCSTLQLIHSLMHGELASFKIKRDQMAFAQQDLFLLENQLPYQLLKLLMSSSEKYEELKITIEEFVQGKIMATKKKKSTWHKPQPGHASINMENTEEELEPSEPTHLLELLRTKMLGFQEPYVKKVQAQRQSFRSIQELKAAGIHFRPSKKSSLRDISFTSLHFAGLLRLPPISVDDSMGLQFMNLIAYEMCPDFENDFGVSSYIGFLDSLIEHADDVKELRKAGVLHNFLGSDEEVAQLFNEIGTDLVTDSDAYLTVKAKIEKHFKSKFKTWLAYFCHEHFSNASPWTVLLSSLVFYWHSC